MPFIWKDPTYWERVSESSKRYLKVFVPLNILLFLLMYLFVGDRVSLLHQALFVILIGNVLFEASALMFGWRSPNIPDSYHPVVRIGMTIAQLFITLLVLFYLWVHWIEPNL